MPGVVILNSIQDSITIDRDSMKLVTISKMFFSNGYIIAIDLDNDGGNGPYGHTVSGIAGLKLGGSYSIGVKTDILDEWEVNCGTIKSIDDTSAVIAWWLPLFLSLRDTSTPISNISSFSFPLMINTCIEDGEFINVVDGWTETVSGVNTGITISDAKNNQITPAVGDLIYKATKISGSGMLNLNSTLWYWGDTIDDI